jgi:general secretion pathway protein F
MERPQLRGLVARLREGVRSGKGLGDSMAAEGAFPRYFVGLVRAGERSGALDQVLQQLAQIVARREAMQQAVRSALQYPAIVLVAAVVSVLILMLGVIPEFAPLFPEDAVLPLTTRAVLGASELLRSQGWFLLGALILLVLLLRYALRRPATRRAWDRALLRMPLFGEIATKLDVSRISWTLGNLLRNGIEVVEALSMAAETGGNGMIRERVAAAGSKLRKGEGLATPLAETGIFPHTATQLIAVGEHSGQLDQMLIKVGDIYEAEARRRIDRLLGLLVPIITAVMGVFVAGIIGSIISAILSSYEMPI